MPADAGRSSSGDAREPQFDLYGNELERALAEYHIGRGGTLYERHAPDTAVQKLGSPGT